MQNCRICGSADFYKEAGYYFCQTCQTQNEDIREEVLELRVDSTTKLRKTKIKQLKSDISGQELGWTSWELYNFVLIGLTDELLGLGVPADIKLTILQLWATYLGKIEVAFISTKKRSLPKLARRYKSRDAEIIYGKVRSQKMYRKRKRSGSSTNTSVVSGAPSEGSSSMRELNKHKRLLATADYDRYIQSQGSSDGLSVFSQSAYSVQSSSVKSSDNEGRVHFSSHAKEEAKKIKKLSKNIRRSERVHYRTKHITTQYKIGPHLITPMRLWAIIYLALRIHNQPIQLGDMLRYGREGHLSYYKLDHLLPPEISLTAKERSFLTQNVEITHKGMRRIVGSMAKFLGVWDIVCPDLSSLVDRYCQELGLPRGIQLYAKRLIALSPPKMGFDKRKSYIPNYEGRAIAFIIVVLKILLALDDITEYHISRIAEKINSVIPLTLTKMQHGNITSCDNALNKTQEKIGVGDCKCYESNAPCIIVHGGAGNFSDSIVIEKMTACKKAAINGYKKLMKGETSVDAVESALWWLECDEFFNCSYGSVLNELGTSERLHDLRNASDLSYIVISNVGQVQMDASIMDGFTFKCGSVAAVSDIEHPITLAKYVLNNFPNSIFVGDGAKNLAKHANLNWISEGNMVAPAARIAFHSEQKGELEAVVDDQSLLDINASSSVGTVGCVVYDGYSVAAGTTTGGLNKKLVGRVGDSPILGCGTYATRNVGCSLTGHGESIMRLGLARAIVDDVERNLSSEEALHKHFSYMLKKFEQVGGGIVLQSNGRWATYFTSDKMPYAVIENDLITYGARPYEEKKEIYNGDGKDCECKSIERGLLNEKLFSFREWQRYVECRKAILVNAHFPTKIKYSPSSRRIDDLYLKFLEFITSKSNRKETDLKSSKHCLPEELISAMAKHISRINTNELATQAVDIFPASLTPLYSYLEYLLDHPLYDIPSIARSDFVLTKVGYLTRPDSLIELAMKCDIELEIIDRNVHFLEKMVPPFEQPRMPSVNELKQLIDVQDDSKGKQEVASESLNDYLHAKVPCVMMLDVDKKQYYDSIKSTIEGVRNINLGSDFTFTETLPNGKLAIPCDNDSSDNDSSDNEAEEKNPNLTNVMDPEPILLKKKFCDKYNLHLSLAEKESIRKSSAMEEMRSKKLKVQSGRNSKGQFAKESNLPIKIEQNDDPFATGENANFYSSTQTSVNEKRIEVEDVANEEVFMNNYMLEDINLSNIDIDFDGLNLKSGLFNISDYFNFSDISFFNENNDIVDTASSNTKEVDRQKYQFFRPFKEYWMYHCIFSRVKQKNFAIFEKALPRSFRWLLNECALIVEMSTEDLYEEVCLIESYHSHTLKSFTGKTDAPNDVDSISKNHWNFILNKW